MYVVTVEDDEGAWLEPAIGFDDKEKAIDHVAEIKPLTDYHCRLVIYTCREVEAETVPPGGKPVLAASTEGSNPPDAKSKQLIAAAPDMLAALQDIVKRNEIQHWFNLDAARSAIAKATGRL